MVIARRFVCVACAKPTAARFSQCPKCGAWETCEAISRVDAPDAVNDDRFVQLSRAVAHDPPRISIAKEWDQAFGGGLAQGSTNVLWGRPGAGKTTELLRIAAILGALYVETEFLDPNMGMLKRTADNAQIDCSRIITTTADTPAEAVRAMRSRAWPAIILDSASGFDHDGSGGVRFLKRAVRDTVDSAAAIGATLLIVVHSTRDGDMSGPQWLAHLVDGVFCLSQTSIRVVKNRFGPMPIRVKRTKPRLRLVS